MRKLFKKIVFYAMYSMGALLMLPFFIGGKSFAADDLLRKIAEQSYNSDKMIKEGQNVKTVGVRVLKGIYEVNSEGITKKSMLLKVTRLLLVLTIALSVTMILYNGMMYIIQTGQGKEGKDLIKNVLLIVVGILVSLFSVIIINLIQSIPASVGNELSDSVNGHSNDNKVLEKTTSRSDIRNNITGRDDDEDDGITDTEKEAIKYLYEKGYDEFRKNPENSSIMVLSGTDRIPLLEMYDYILNS